MADPSISSLLALRRTQIVTAPKIVDHFGDMVSTWCRLWRDFIAFQEVKDGLFGARQGREFVPRTLVAARLMDHLVAEGLVGLIAEGHVATSPHAERLLRGAWLEELGASIAKVAGADEVCASQVVKWISHYDKQQYFNEIDVIARYTDCLVFVSCKAIAPLSAQGRLGSERIFDAIKEVAYWRDHFGGKESRAILLTTADFFDEAFHRVRNSSLLEHADVLRVSIVSGDFGDFDGLVEGFRRAIRS